MLNLSTQGQRLKEATKINLSLSALGNVISALVCRYSIKAHFNSAERKFGKPTQIFRRRKV
jgi:hypothetical protein